MTVFVSSLFSNDHIRSSFPLRSSDLCISFMSVSEYQWPNPSFKWDDVFSLMTYCALQPISTLVYQRYTLLDLCCDDFSYSCYNGYSVSL